MESKHSYFKRICRSAQNFVNILHTFSERHQLLQAAYTEGSLFLEDEERVISQCITNRLKDLSPAIVGVLISSGLCISNSDEATATSESVTIRGINYRRGMLLPFRRQDDGMPSFIKIRYVVLSGGCEAHILGDVHGSLWQKCLGLYELESNSNMECVKFSECLDMYPLPIYQLGGRDVTVLKHGILDMVN